MDRWIHNWTVQAGLPTRATCTHQFRSMKIALMFDARCRGNKHSVTLTFHVERYKACHICEYQLRAIAFCFVKSTQRDKDIILTILQRSKRISAWTGIIGSRSQSTNQKSKMPRTCLCTFLWTAAWWKWCCREDWTFLNMTGPWIDSRGDLNQIVNDCARSGPQMDIISGPCRHNYQETVPSNEPRFTTSATKPKDVQFNRDMLSSTYCCYY